MKKTKTFFQHFRKPQASKGLFAGPPVNHEDLPIPQWEERKDDVLLIQREEGQVGVLRGLPAAAISRKWLLISNWQFNPVIILPSQKRF